MADSAHPSISGAVPVSLHPAAYATAPASPEGADASNTNVASCVGEIPQERALTDADREDAIRRAAVLVEYLHSLSQLHWALWCRDGAFEHKAGYDVAIADCHAARGIFERLIRGRSPDQVARMERERGLHLPACANEEAIR